MNVVVGDLKTPFDVAPGFNPYEFTLSLPVGKHFLRTEYANDFVSNAVPASSRQLTVRSVDVTGATIDNANTDANALAAADTYIKYGRQGSAHVQLHGAAPGAQVEVKLKSHAFNFGGAIPGFSSSTTLNNAAFSAFIDKHFNMLVGTNAGKWSTNEGYGSTSTQQNNARDVPLLTYADEILAYADAHNMRARQHNLIWGDQQPSWVNSMLANPGSADPPPKGAGQGNLLGLYGAVDGLGQPISEISERIGYYTGGYVNGVVDPDNQRADKYAEMDVYNEPVHTGVNRAGSYWTRYGAAGISNIIQETAQAVQATGSSTKLYVNEYNVLQNSTDPVSLQNDPYANWYRNYVETIQNADDNPANGPISGVGLEYYALPGHSAAYMQRVLANMSGTGLPLTLSEFGVQDNLSIMSDNQPESEVIRTMTEAIRMMFGSPNATTFMYWGWSTNLTSDLQRASPLVDGTYVNLTNAGKAYEDLLGIQDWDGDPDNGWTTQKTLTVSPDGAIDFTGFFGDYEVKIGNSTFALDLTKGVDDYSLIVGPPSADFNRDGAVDGDDFLAWQTGFGATSDATLEMGDADYDGDVDAFDLGVWKSAFAAALAAQHSVPEPQSLLSAFVGAVTVISASRRGTRRR